MNIAITFRQMESTEAVKGYATDKVAKIQKFLRQPLKSKVTLSCESNRLHTAEIDVHSGQEHYHAHETTEDMYASIDKVVDKIERQIRTQRGSLLNRKGADRASDHLLPDVGEE
jgi:putative sigma-54 modulation protein